MLTLLNIKDSFNQTFNPSDTLDIIFSQYTGLVLFSDAKWKKYVNLVFGQQVDLTVILSCVHLIIY